MLDLMPAPALAAAADHWMSGQSGYRFQGWFVRADFRMEFEILGCERAGLNPKAVDPRPRTRKVYLDLRVLIEVDRLRELQLLRGLKLERRGLYHKHVVGRCLVLS